MVDFTIIVVAVTDTFPSTIVNVMVNAIAPLAYQSEHHQLIKEQYCFNQVIILIKEAPVVAIDQRGSQQQWRCLLLKTMKCLCCSLGQWRTTSHLIDSP